MSTCRRYLMYRLVILFTGCLAAGSAATEADDVKLPSGIYLWYQAESLKGLHDGQTVNTWKDQGPHHFDLERVSGDPTYVKSDINGLPAVHTRLQQPDHLVTRKPVTAIAGNPDLTIFLLAKIANPQNKQLQFTMWGNGEAGAGGCMFFETDVGRIDLGSGLSADASPPDESFLPFYDKPCILMASKSPGPMNTTTQITYNGTDQPIVASSSSHIPDIESTPLRVGGGPEHGIAELIIFDRKLNPAEQNQVGYYLAQKCGLKTNYVHPKQFSRVQLHLTATPSEVNSRVTLRGGRKYIRGSRAKVVAKPTVTVLEGPEATVYVFEAWEGDVADPKSPKTKMRVHQDTTLNARYKKMGTVHVYVSREGRDVWSGNLAQPNADRSDGPVATLARARQIVRQKKTQDGRILHHYRIVVDGGTYFLEETLELTDRDSGGPFCPVVYAPAPGEEVILSGGSRLRGWKPYQGKIFRCSLPDNVTENFRSLFFNNKRQVRARYPDFDWKDPIHGGWAFMKDYRHEEDNRDGTIIPRPNTFTHHWSKPEQGEVFMFVGNNWHNAIMPIRSVNNENKEIRLVGRTRHGVDRHPEMLVEKIEPPLASWWPMQTGGIPGARYRVENLLEELDQPGEWCVDMEDRVVYFWPPEDTPLEESEVIVPRLNRLIDLQGTSHMTISDMIFMHTNGGDNQHPAIGDGYGPMFPLKDLKYCGEAIRMQKASNCRIENNRFLSLDGNGVYLHGQNMRNVVHGNEFAHAGASSVGVLGSMDSCPLNNEVTDNYIHDGGHFDKYSAGVFLGVSRGTRVAHNLIEDVPRDAISLGNNGFGRNIIEYNEIRRACREISEAGAIGAWMEYSGPGHEDMLRSGHTIRFNRVADSAGSTGQETEEGKNENATIISMGIFLDNDCCNCFLYGNIILRCPTGIGVHGGSHNLLENNIFVDCHIPIWWAPYRLPNWGGNSAHRNIMYFSDPAYTTSDGAGRGSYELTGIPHYIDGFSDGVIGYCDNNLIFNSSGGPYPICADYGGPRKRTFEEWKKMGFDRSTIFADPMFVDQENDNHQLELKSPAWKLGFQRIDYSKIGPRNHFRKMGTP